MRYHNRSGTVPHYGFVVCRSQMRTPDALFLHCLRSLNLYVVWRYRTSGTRCRELPELVRLSRAGNYSSPVPMRDPHDAQYYTFDL